MTTEYERCHRCFGRGYIGGSFKTCPRCDGSGSRRVGEYNHDPWGWDPGKRTVTYNGRPVSEENPP